jgi:hypothetical protein
MRRWQGGPAAAAGQPITPDNDRPSVGGWLLVSQPLESGYELRCIYLSLRLVMDRRVIAGHCSYDVHLRELSMLL